MTDSLETLLLQRVREQEFRSLMEFADSAGIGRASLYNLLRLPTSARAHQPSPSLEIICKLAKALDLSAAEVLYLVCPEAPRGNVPTSTNPPNQPNNGTGKAVWYWAGKYVLSPAAQAAIRILVERLLTAKAMSLKKAVSR